MCVQETNPPLQCFQLQTVISIYESSIHNIAFSSEKVVSFESEEKYYKQKQSKTVLKNMWVNFDVRRQQVINIFTGGSIIMSMD